MDAKSLRKELELRAGSSLVPSNFTTEMLLSLSKLLNESNFLLLSIEEKEEIVPLFIYWIKQITQEQSVEKHAFFIEYHAQLLWACIGQLEYLLHQEIVCRQLQVRGSPVEVNELFIQRRLSLNHEKLPKAFTSLPTN